MSFRCLVCAGTGAATVLADCPDTYLSKPFRVAYVRCVSCGLLQQDPVPGDVSPFYESYPIHVKKSAVHRMLQRIVMRPVYFRARALPERSVLLDYGCGDGGYLDGFVPHEITRVGFEPDPAHAARLSERLALPVLSDPERLLAEWAGKVDVMTMHFVLEHVTKLDEVFERAARLLKPGGVLHVVVPHAFSFEARLFGRAWHNLDAPRHVSFPESAAMTTLAGRHGLALTSEHPVPFPNGFAGSLAVALTGRFRWWLFALALPAGIVFSRLFPGGARAYRLTRLVPSA